jgi:hypothetical protein
VDAEQALKLLKETKFNTLLAAVEFTKRYAGKNQSDMTINELVSEFREMKESVVFQQDQNLLLFL